MRDSDAMMALVNAIKKCEDPAVNRWDGVLTVIVGRKGIVFEDGSPRNSSRHEMEPGKRCAGLWQLLCEFSRHILIVHAYTTGK